MDQPLKGSGGGKVTIFDVAEKAGVSFVSVSRVFNGHTNVSERMQKRVLEAARVLGYQPRLVSRPGLIGILVRDRPETCIERDLHTFCSHLFHAAARRNYFMEIIPITMTHLLVQHLVDGIIEVDLGAQELMALTNLPKIPVVLTQSRNPYPHWSSVCVDYENEATLALDQVTRAGHERVAVLMDCRDSLAANTRKRVIRERLSHRHAKTPVLRLFDNSEKPLEHHVEQILGDGHTALVNFSTCGTGPLLDQLLNVQKCRIPEDLSLLMLDNSDICGHYHPRISFIRQPLEEVAETAIEELVRLIQGQPPRKNLLFPSRYVDNKSIRNLTRVPSPAGSLAG